MTKRVRKDGLVRAYAAWGSGASILLKQPRFIKVRGEIIVSGLCRPEMLTTYKTEKKPHDQRTGDETV
jgi:hypothetical protein